MRTLRTSLVAVTLLSALAGQAFANSCQEHEGPRGPMSEQMMKHMAQRHEQQLGELKAKLKLEASQDSAWQQFHQAMQPPAHGPQHPDRTAMEKMTTPERLDRMQQMHAQRQTEMQKRTEAIKTFYAALKPEQRLVFDKEFGKHAPGQHRKHEAGHKDH